ncbi:MAG: glycosyl transferase [Burkholderiaceae bacterium]|nr:glycosyl transferase [Burkholderiaceae bacterium]
MIRQLARRAAPGLIGRLVLTLNLPEPVPDDWAGLGGFKLEIIRNRVPAGFAANHNRALAGCARGLVAILNPDLQLEGPPLPDATPAPGRDALSLLCGATSEPGVGLAVPQVLEADGTASDSARDLLTPASILSRTLRARRHASASPAWYAGMCMVLPASAWRAVGGFDERYRMYCEDFDLCARLRLAGLSLVQVPEARIVHAARRASRRSPRHLGWHVRSLLRVWRSDAYRDYRQLLRAEAGHGARPSIRSAG